MGVVSAITRKREIGIMDEAASFRWDLGDRLSIERQGMHQFRLLFPQYMKEDIDIDELFERLLDVLADPPFLQPKEKTPHLQILKGGKENP